MKDVRMCTPPTPSVFMLLGSNASLLPQNMVVPPGRSLPATDEEDGLPCVLDWIHRGLLGSVNSSLRLTIATTVKGPRHPA